MKKMNTKARYPAGVSIETEPSFAISRCTLLEIPADETLVETMPRMNANAATLLVHAIRLPRSVRSACAVGEESRRRRGAALSRAGSTPVPMSRPAAIRAASTSSSTLATAGSSRTTGWAPVNGRSSSVQPSGVAQRSQPAPLEVSPITRSNRNSATMMAAVIGTTSPESDGEATLSPSTAERTGEPQDQRARRDRTHRREIHRPPPDGPSENELHPARVLLAAQCAHRGQQSEDSG